MKEKRSKAEQYARKRELHIAEKNSEPDLMYVLRYYDITNVAFITINSKFTSVYRYTNTGITTNGSIYFISNLQNLINHLCIKI